jgi:DNA-binding SARP family transcriptional activator/Tfp pilus assembly protein PilF
MWFGILGPLLVRDGDVVVGVAAARQRVVLAALLVHAGSVVPAHELAELVWDGAPPAGAATTLRSHVMRLRRALGPGPAGRVVTRHPGYLVEAREEEVDLLRFARLCREGGAAVRAGAWQQASELLNEALGLWRGEPLGDVTCAPLRRDELPRLEQLRLQALEWRIDTGLHLARHAELMAELQSLTALHPLRERFHAQLMLALYRCGRQAEALAAYRNARRLLIAELGAEPGTGHFIGRATELASLTGLLDNCGGQKPIVIAAISGTAGVGKTALAVQWAHQVAGRFPDGQLYVNLRGYDPAQPVSATDALAGFLRSLGVSGQDIPAEEDERAARYRSILASKRMLVVLDNAGTARQVRPLLPGNPACAVVVTSRDSLAALVARDGARRLDLDQLPLDDAVNLLRALIGERADADPDDATVALAGQCCRLPLALRVAAELAAANPDVPLAVLVGELADQQQRLGLLAAGGDAGTAVRAVFSWSYRHLDTRAARTFRLAGRDAARHEGDRAAEATALNHLAGPHRRQGRHQQAISQYRRALELFRQAGDHTGQAHALGNLGNVRADQGRYQAATSLHEQALNLYRQIRDRAGEARTLGNLGYIEERQGRYQQAAGLLHQALDLCRETGCRFFEAEALTRIGDVRLRQGRPPEAAGHLQAALALCREIGNQSGEADALNSLGEILLATGQPGGARTQHAKALDLGGQIGDKYQRARAHNGLSHAYDAAGDFGRARSHWQEALTLYAELGAPQPVRAEPVRPAPARPGKDAASL